MLKTIKEVNIQIQELCELEGDLICLQNYHLGHYDKTNEATKERNASELMLKYDLKLHQDVRSILSESAKLVGKEIKRLRNIINETKVDV